ncbi:MAG: dihydroorotate dehydrogenase [Phenylobacterium zucineum]|nr:MAG: dihydroorotate dehydrogenase [Phenylobacterium zucineum]
MTLIYKILPRAEWDEAQAKGRFEGSAVDVVDGYIHFSTAVQAPETARRYFKDLPDLIVLGVEADDLGAALRWEPSRGGDLFPHLYGPLDCDHVLDARDAPLGDGGVPDLGDLK